jgi:chemotaxis protein methyltransferase CheR
MNMELSRETGKQLAELIYSLCGLVLGENKDYLIRHRLEPLVVREGLADFEQFLDRLKGRDGARLHDPIVEAITTKETSFFRDPTFFEALEKVVIPECLANVNRHAGQRHRVRIWSAACSTGQEPYSIAMLVRDFTAVRPEIEENSFTILASDISTDSVESAKTGCYNRNDVDRGLSPELLARHFQQNGTTWCVTEQLRRLVQFRRFDLMQTVASLGVFDLIVCRNVMIYFDESTRKRVCDGFHAILHPGGWLAVGAAESLHGIDDRFEAIRIGRTVLYRKRQADC